MSEIGLSSIDTPKKASLQHDIREIRRQLKDFEKRFLFENGRKPKPDDVKQDVEVAAKYKKYNRLQDVLSGKLRLEDIQTKPSIGHKHRRRDSGIGSSPRQKKSIVETPRRSKEPQHIDFDDETTAASPRLLFRTAIGPTPHRDGKVLGLFDCLDGSGGSASSSCRKRKIDALYGDTPVQRSPLKIIQTPSRRSEKRAGDLLEHLHGTPIASREAGKLSRTPQSDGRKFQLSQFFATPTTQRVLFSPIEQTSAAIPLRDALLKGTPERKLEPTNLDSTPTYLKRTASFKDRLLSALQQEPAQQRRPARVGPPTLKHFRSSTSNIFSLKDVHTKQQSVQQDTNDDYDDDLEALREMEGDVTNSRVLVPDSQPVPNIVEKEEDQLITKPYKKKGQKRTTRKATIKPASFSKKVSESCFVDADESDEDTQDKNSTPDDHDHEYSDEPGPDDHDVARNGVKNQKKDGKSAKSSTKREAGKINPNAQSHMNFKTLKIKNKNSRAKNAGRSKFSRRR